MWNAATDNTVPTAYDNTVNDEPENETNRLRNLIVHDFGADA